MKQFHIEIIHSRGSTTYLEDRIITAQSLEARSSGCYVFWNGSDPIAYYPIVNTIITEIKSEEE